MRAAVLVAALALTVAFAAADAEACPAEDHGCAAAPTAAELSLLQLEKGHTDKPIHRLSGRRHAKQRPGPGKAGAPHPVNADVVSPKRGLVIDAKHYKETGKVCPILYKFGKGAVKPWFYNYGAKDALPGIESDYQTCVFEYDSGFIPMESINHKGIVNQPLLVSEALLGFHEPNMGSLRLSPWEAAQLWPEMVKRSQESGIPRIGSPSASGEHLWDWFDAFFDECSECQVDFMTVHVFKPRVLGPRSLQAVVAELYEQYDLPIWVTEFNNGGIKQNKTMEQHLAYMQAALPLLESLPYIEKYAWHSTYSNDIPGAALIHKRSGRLTKLGEFYRDYKLPKAAKAANEGGVPPTEAASLAQLGEELSAGVETTTLVLR